MGFTSGGPRGVGVVTSPFTPKSDMTDILAVVAARGAHLGNRTTAERDAITGAALFAGLTVYNTDTSTIDLYNGSGWVTWEKAPTSYTPTLTGFSAGTGGTVVGRYWISSGVVHCKVDVTMGSSPGASGPFYIGLPLTAATSILHIGAFVALGPSDGRLAGVVGLDTSTRVWMLRGDSNNFLSNATWTWGSGNRISFTAAYLLP